jgi:hypothetical protein
MNAILKFYKHTSSTKEDVKETHPKAIITEEESGSFLIEVTLENCSEENHIEAMDKYFHLKDDSPDIFTIEIEDGTIITEEE